MPRNGRDSKQLDVLDMPVRKATLKDVAELCGVSTMTISRFLNNKGFVSNAVSARIRKAVAELGYTPNLVAKSLRDNRTLTLGMVITDSSDLLFSRMTKGVVDAASAEDYSVMITNAQQSGELQRKSITMLLNKRIDGLILGAPYPLPDEQVRELRSHGIPVVILMRTNNQGIDFVNSDNFKGAYDMLCHILGMGIRDIHFINLYHRNPNGEERRVAQRKAMIEHGLPYDEDRMIFSYPSIEAGAEAMRELLARGVRSGAVVCGGDVLAIGAIETCLAAGVRVPEDIRICGFDDSDMLNYLKVPLTTMRQDVCGMALNGVRILLERQRDPGGEQVRMRLPCEMIVRQST